MLHPSLDLLFAFLKYHVNSPQHIQYTLAVFEITTSHLVVYFSGNAEEPLNQRKRSKNQLWGLKVTVTYARSVGFVYFAIRILWNCPFLMSLMNFFSYILSRFHQNLSHHFIIEIFPPCLSFKLFKSNQFKVDIKSREGLTWNSDMWLTNLSKTACAALSPTEMSNQIAKFNSWKLIAARWILHQHNINVITTNFKYLIRQFNLTSEWDLIFQLATLRVKGHLHF